MQEIADYSLMYPQLLALYYRYTGDAAALLPYYETALGMIRHFAQYERADGLLMQVADKWNLVDWPENLRDDYDFALTRPVVGAGCHNVINALYLGAKKRSTGLPVCWAERSRMSWKNRFSRIAGRFTGRRRGFLRTVKQAATHRFTPTCMPCISGFWRRQRKHLSLSFWKNGDFPAA